MPHSSINRVTLVGNLTHDPELRTLTSGATVCHMRVACNSRRRNSEGGYDSKPNYFDVSVFGPQSENAHRYLRKGRPVAIDGRLEWREWETVDQQRRQAVTIVAGTVQFLRGSDQVERDSDLVSDIEQQDTELFVASGSIEDELDDDVDAEEAELIAAGVEDEGDTLAAAEEEQETVNEEEESLVF